MVSPDEFERIARENERRLYTDALFILRSHADDTKTVCRKFKQQTVF
ncbi:MAG: hypothetical protein PUI48_07650 [Oscillospiraceae bacterium]|nr:hypothetical protein [Oscillospiraceae bacterium]MDY3793163.1 hypothetical protein [Oscillospiraceae bacterium]MDY6209155.1 hypothetical protein [Oscillospiraceae bacterium]